MSFSLDHDYLNTEISEIENILKQNRTPQGILHDPDGIRYKLFYLYQLLREPKRSKEFLDWYDEEFIRDYGEVETIFLRALILFNLREQKDANTILKYISRENLNFFPLIFDLELFVVKDYPHIALSFIQFRDELQFIIKEFNKTEKQWLLDFYNSPEHQFFIKITMDYYLKFPTILNSNEKLAKEIMQYRSYKFDVELPYKYFTIAIPIPELKIERYEKIIDAIWSYKKDYKGNPYYMFSEIISCINHYLNNNNEECYSIGKFKIFKAIEIGDNCYFEIERNGEIKKINSLNNWAVEGLTTILEIIDFMRTGDTLLIRDICFIFYKIKMDISELLLHDEFIDFQNSDSTIFKGIEVDGIKAQLKIHNKKVVLTIKQKIEIKTYTIDENQVIESITNEIEKLRIDDKKTLHQYIDYIPETIAAIIHGGNQDIYLTFCFDEWDIEKYRLTSRGEDWNLMNSHYWETGKRDPEYAKKNWYLMGEIELHNDRLVWNSSHNLVYRNEDCNLEWLEVQTGEELNERLKRFILKDKKSIISFFDKLEISYGEILEDSLSNGLDVYPPSFYL